MKIISWNVNGLRAIHKKGNFNWLLESGADIICLQETKSLPEQLPVEIAQLSGFSSYFNFPTFKKGYSGVALYSRETPEVVIWGMDGNNKDPEGRIIGGVFKDFILVNVYFPNGGGGPDRLAYKLKFYDDFLLFLGRMKKTYTRPIIFCGDINTAHTEIDLARPKENEHNTGFLAEERAWLDEVLRAGYSDIFRDTHPRATGAYTYWDMKTFARERNVGWRIDYFFVTQDLVPRVKKVEILDTILGSDHCPVTLEF